MKLLLSVFLRFWNWQFSFFSDGFVVVISIVEGRFNVKAAVSFDSFSCGSPEVSCCDMVLGDVVTNFCLDGDVVSTRDFEDVLDFGDESVFCFLGTWRLSVSVSLSCKEEDVLDVVDSGFFLGICNKSTFRFCPVGNTFAVFFLDTFGESCLSEVTVWVVSESLLLPLSSIDTSNKCLVALEGLS